MEERWIETLRKRFADRRCPVSDSLWNDIETAMTDRDIIGREHKEYKINNRRILVLMKRIVAVAACIAVIIGIWYFSYTDVEQITDVTGSGFFKKRNFSPQTISTHEAVDGVLSNAHIVAIPRKYARLYSDNTILVNDKVSEGQPVNVDIEELGKDNDNAEIHDTVVSVNENKSKDIVSDAGGQTFFYSDNDNLQFASNLSKREKSSVDFGLYGSNLTSMNNSSESGGNYMRNELQSDMMVFGDYVKNFKPFYDNNPRLNGETETKVKHHQPVKLGLSVRFRFSDRFGIESGLSYSYLSSDISTGNTYDKCVTRQKLHYVGVPLNINFNLWRNKKFDTYVSGGGMVEFCVSGRSSTKASSDGSVWLETETNVRDTRPQFSGNVSAGVQYNFSRQFGVYVEPGVSCYFDNGSNVITIYKDKPFNFNLNLGLRFSVK